MGVLRINTSYFFSASFTSTVGHDKKSYRFIFVDFTSGLKHTYLICENLISLFKFEIMIWYLNFICLLSELMTISVLLFIMTNSIQSTLIISTSVISNNRLSRRENLIPV